MITPLQMCIADDILMLDELKADIRQTVGAPLPDGREPADPLEALEAHYGALLRRAVPIGRPFES